MRLDLYRKLRASRATIGELHVNGAFFCFTLEDVARPDGVKVKHQTAIPPGEYEVVMTWSNRFQKVMPRLVNVPMFEGVLIHVGNTEADTSGCILVGRKRENDRITESKSAFAELYNLLGKAVTRGKVFIVVHRLPGDTNSSSQPVSQSNPQPNPQQPAPLVRAAENYTASSPSPSNYSIAQPASVAPTRLMSTFARYLPFLTPLLGGVGEFYSAYKIHFWWAGIGVLLFWAGWLARSPLLERKHV